MPVILSFRRGRREGDMKENQCDNEELDKRMSSHGERSSSVCQYFMMIFTCLTQIYEGKQVKVGMKSLTAKIEEIHNDKTK
jgi:hypothetical protein